MVSDTKVGELMSGRRKRTSSFLGVPSGKWVMWSIGVFGAVIVGYFGVIQRVDLNTESLRKLEQELIEARKQSRLLEVRLNAKDVQDALVAKHLDEDEAVRELLRAIENFSDPGPRRRR